VLIRIKALILLEDGYIITIKIKFLILKDFDVNAIFGKLLI